jgi:hypothetical protein
MTDDEVPSDLEKLNALYRGPQWRLTQARQDHVDEFGDTIDRGDIEYIRDLSDTFNSVLRLSEKSFITLVRLIFKHSPELDDVVTGVAQERMREQLEKVRAAMDRMSKAQTETYRWVEEERERRNREKDAIHPRHRERKTMTAEELLRSVWSKSTVELAKDFGVSDVAISKKCKAFGIPKPPPGFWRRVEAGKIAHPRGIPPSNSLLNKV